MARSKQSLKRHKTDTVKAKRNRSRMRTLRSAIRNVRDAQTPEERETAYKKAQSLIDKSGRKRLIHPNKAKRLKSSLS